MLRFLTDEDFHGDITRGLLRHRPELDIVRVQDVGLMSQPDSSVLDWAAQDGRILLTHDVNTMPKEAYERLQVSLPMPGLLVVSHILSIGQAIARILLIADLIQENEIDRQVRYVP
jgi:hypothetical protein